MSLVLCQPAPYRPAHPDGRGLVATTSATLPASERFNALLRLARREARRSGNNERVLEVYRQAHRMAKAHGTREQVSLAAVGIGLACLELGQVSEGHEALVSAGRP